MGERYIAACGYSRERENDLLLARLSPEGALEALHGLCLGDNPSYLAFAQDTLYVGSEIEECARIRAYRVRPASFQLLKEIELPGSGLCHLAATPDGLFASCYGSGSFFGVDFALEHILWRYDPPADGREHHAHWMAACGPWLYGVDLGADNLLRWPLPGLFMDGCPPEALSMPKGSGPRQVLCQSPDAAFVVQETKAAVTPLLFPGDGWEAGESLPLAPGGNYPSGACVSRQNVLYVPVRGADTLAAVQVSKGRATLLWEQPLPGEWPRHCSLVLSERFLLVSFQKSHELCCFSVDENAPRLTSKIPLGGAACALEVIIGNEDGT